MLFDVAVTDTSFQPTFSRCSLTNLLLINSATSELTGDTCLLFCFEFGAAFFPSATLLLGTDGFSCNNSLIAGKTVRKKSLSLGSNSLLLAGFPRRNSSGWGPLPQWPEIEIVFALDEPTRKASTKMISTNRCLRNYQ